MTMSDTELDVDLLHEIEGAIPCEVRFLHESPYILDDQPARYILRVTPTCTGTDCEINKVSRVTVLICPSCLVFAQVAGWRLNHGDGHNVEYLDPVAEPINKAAT